MANTETLTANAKQPSDTFIINPTTFVNNFQNKSIFQVIFMYFLSYLSQTDISPIACFNHLSVRPQFLTKKDCSFR